MGIRILLFKKRDRDDEAADSAGGTAATSDDEKRRRGRLALIIAIPVLAIIGIILFIIMQDMRLRMAIVDWWTIAHAILFIGGILGCVFAYGKTKNTEEPPAEAPPPQPPAQYTATA